LAQEFGVRYQELYRLTRLLNTELERHPTSRQFEVPAWRPIQICGFELVVSSQENGGKITRTTGILHWYP
jgi:hypothetical protein